MPPTIFSLLAVRLAEQTILGGCGPEPLCGPECLKQKADAEATDAKLLGDSYGDISDADTVTVPDEDIHVDVDYPDICSAAACPPQDSNFTDSDTYLDVTPETSLEDILDGGDTQPADDADAGIDASEDTSYVDCSNDPLAEGCDVFVPPPDIDEPDETESPDVPDADDPDTDDSGEVGPDVLPPVDSDNDGISDKADNCPNIKNPDQVDDDGDNIGNACETDLCDGPKQHPFEGVKELCDGLDNDCDDQIDEDFSMLGKACWSPVYLPTGTCNKEGAIVCNPLDTKKTACDNSAELLDGCDGADNDCDDEIDEDAGATVCGIDICKHTVDNCLNGAIQLCDPFEGAKPEICDGADNDCNGETDELGQTSCGVGECANAVEACVLGQPQMCIEKGSQPEAVACDGKDNDCDGVTDEIDDAQAKYLVFGGVAVADLIAEVEPGTVLVTSFQYFTTGTPPADAVAVCHHGFLEECENNEPLPSSCVTKLVFEGSPIKNSLWVWQIWSDNAQIGEFIMNDIGYPADTYKWGASMFVLGADGASSCSYSYDVASCSK